MRQFTASRATTETYELAEGPVWDHINERLLWVDIAGGDVHTGVLHSGTVIPTDTHHIDTTVGAVAPAPTGMLVAGHHDVWMVEATGVAHVAGPIPDGQQRRLNDGKCDPSGRFLVGTLSLGESTPESLYAIGPSGRVTVLDDDLQMSNGLAWSPDGTVLYSVDTTPGIVWRRPYDPLSGTCGQRRESFRVTGGVPDGICIDSDGNLWVAIWGSGEVRQYTPDGEILSLVTVPAPHTSCVTFAGPEFDQLIISTARVDLTSDQLETYPQSGSLFAAHVDTHGLPAYCWQP